MWIKLDLDGLVFQLQINDYRLAKKDIWDEQWCRVSCSIVDEKNGIINYHASANELLLCGEVEEIIASIDKLLNNGYKSNTKLEFES